MELRQLKTFRVVATLNSFYQAANALEYAQSTVSQHIKALEDELGVPLFDRLGKRIALTEAGEVLLQYAQKMLDIEEEMRTEVTQREYAQGSLSIRIPETASTYFLPPILNEFQRLYPKISFNFTSCTYYSLQQELQSGITDLAFLITDAFQAATLATEILCTLPLVVVSHPHNPLLEKTELVLQDLASQPLLFPTNDCNYRMPIQRMMAEAKIEPDVVLQYNSVEAIKRCLVGGVGVAVLPEIAVREEVAAGLLSVLPWKGQTIMNAHLIMIWHNSKWLCPTLVAFMETTTRIVALSHSAYYP